MCKDTFRKKYKKLRKSLFDVNKNESIVDNFLNSEVYKNSNSIFVTDSINDELDTSRIIIDALNNNKDVYLPKVIVEKKIMKPVQIHKYPEDLSIGYYGIKEPISNEFSDTVPDLIVVPGLVFNHEGYRIGYGGGYFDKYLGEYNPNTIALIRSEFIIDYLPLESFDKPVDLLVTEKGIYKTKERSKN